jgi:hypothetical protein
LKEGRREEEGEIDSLGIRTGAWKTREARHGTSVLKRKDWRRNGVCWERRGRAG